MKKLLAVFGLLLTVITAPAVAEYEEGFEYKLLDKQPPVAKGTPIEVVEFFWYGCPHCFKFEPYIKNWKTSQPADTSFVKIPATFGKTARFHAFVYYALDLMGEEERVSDAIFSAMHKQGKKLANQADMEAFLAEQGVDIATFRKAMKSFAVDNRVNRASTLFSKYMLRGVPVLVVGGRYVSGDVKNYQEMINVTNHMIDLAREEQQAAD